MYYIQISSPCRHNPMETLQTQTQQCPYCWEDFEIVLDCSELDQEYVEDCSVCCNPIVISVSAAGDDTMHVEARMENG